MGDWNKSQHSFKEMLAPTPPGRFSSGRGGEGAEGEKLFPLLPNLSLRLPAPSTLEHPGVKSALAGLLRNLEAALIVNSCRSQGL